MPTPILSQNYGIKKSIKMQLLIQLILVIIPNYTIEKQKIIIINK